jgi:putative transposase
MVVVVDGVEESQTKFETGKIAGFDFGLKTFLTCFSCGDATRTDGDKIESPQFLKQSLSAIKQANRQHSKKRKGSQERERARLNLVRKYEDVVNRRSERLLEVGA